MERGHRLFAYLGLPVIPMLAHMLAWLVEVTDFRPSRNGGGTVPAAAYSLRQCRRAMVGRGRQSAYVGYPVKPGLLHMLAWLADVTDCREAVARVEPADVDVCGCVRARV
jgi:hypothetical protein